VQFHRSLGVEARKFRDVTLLVEHGLTVRAWRDVLQGKVLNVATTLLLVLLVRQLGLLELHTLLLELVVLKLAGTLLSRVNATEQATGECLYRGHALLAVSGECLESCLEKAAISELATLVGRSAWGWANEPIEK
jgi:hypothetical protein